jgi:hypothetical protein
MMPEINKFSIHYKRTYFALIFLSISFCGDGKMGLISSLLTNL